MYAIIKKENKEVTLYVNEPSFNEDTEDLKKLINSDITSINEINAVKLMYIDGLFVDGVNEDELIDIQSNNIITAYKSHTLKGKLEYERFRVLIVQDVLSGKITEEQAFVIEGLFAPAYDRLYKGDWKTARSILGKTNLEESVLFTEYKESRLIVLDDYISKNYS